MPPDTSTTPLPATPVSAFGAALSLWIKARPRLAALVGFAALMAGLGCILVLSPGEVTLEGDATGAEVLLDGSAPDSRVCLVWPAGSFEVRLRRPAREDVVIVGSVGPLRRVRVTLPPPVPARPMPPPDPGPAATPAADPLLPSPPVVAKPPPPITEEDIAAKIVELETSTDDQLIIPPATERDAQLARTAATRAFARCRAASRWDRTVMVFAPACLWARAHAGAFPQDPWDAATAAAAIAPEGSAARAFLCLARLATALNRPSDATTAFERANVDARIQAQAGAFEEALAVAEAALALSPPEPSLSRFRKLAALCRQATQDAEPR